MGRLEKNKIKRRIAKVGVDEQGDRKVKHEGQRDFFVYKFEKS
jgi:hypothetical protein